MKPRIAGKVSMDHFLSHVQANINIFDIMISTCSKNLRTINTFAAVQVSTEQAGYFLLHVYMLFNHNSEETTFVSGKLCPTYFCTKNQRYFVRKFTKHNKTKHKKGPNPGESIIISG